MRHLVVGLEASPATGAEIQFAIDGTLYAVGSSVWRINVEQAKIEAEALVGAGLGWWRVAPDGSALYFYGSRATDTYPAPVAQCGPPPNPVILRRLDPQTLAVTAECPFEGFYHGFLVTQPQQQGAAVRQRRPPSACSSLPA